MRWSLICRCISKLKQLRSKTKVKNSYRQISLRKKKECWSSETPQDDKIGSLQAAVKCLGIRHTTGCSAARKGQCIGDDTTQFGYDIDWEAKLKEMLNEGVCYRETIVICHNTSSIISPLKSTIIP